MKLSFLSSSTSFINTNCIREDGIRRPLGGGEGGGREKKMEISGLNLRLSANNKIAEKTQTAM